MKLKEHKKLSIMLLLCFMLLSLTLYNVNTVNLGSIITRPWCCIRILNLGDVILRPWSVMTVFIG